MFQWFYDLFKPDDPPAFMSLVGTVSRSPHWPNVRKQFLIKNPVCAISGLTSNLQVHHIKPYHLHPELELEESNLITLSAGPDFNFHLWVGHLGDWKSFNENVLDDCQIWREKIRNRP